QSFKDDDDDKNNTKMKHHRCEAVRKVAKMCNEAPSVKLIMCTYGQWTLKRVFSTYVYMCLCD
ncbi:unnamed protein product, partial [Ceratitis capitata]